jgi:ATP-dependent RNA helicase DDX52/ROK1
VHRIGRTGRAGRKGKAITLFTESDFENLRTIANVMKQSGCEVPDWMLTLKQTRKRNGETERRRPTIDTTPYYDKKKKLNRMQSVRNSKKRKIEQEST